jgi:hypothetical protein
VVWQFWLAYRHYGHCWAIPRSRKIEGVTSRPAYAARALGLVLVDTSASGGLALLPRRRRDIGLARLRHRSLDARLAAGAAPESTRLLAVRAEQLVGPARRRALARRWDALAVIARTRRWWPSEVAGDIQRLADQLGSSRPVGARGVVLAVAMLPVAADGVRRPETGGYDVAAAAAREVLSAM